MAHVDLRKRRDEERGHGSERSWRSLFGAPFSPLFTGPILVALAIAASHKALDQAPPDSWAELLYWVPLAVLLFWGARRLGQPRGRRRGTSDFGVEKLLLLALRDAGGAITAVGAALETPLTVDEADRILSRLANDGHLRIESQDGALYYVLPKLPSAGPLGRE